MKIFSRRNALLAVLACVVTVANQPTAAAPALPNPVLAFLGQEPVEAGGKKSIRYYFEVHNKEAYPADMFAAAPDLPPCGTNKSASRTWVDIYTQSGKRLNGFCALGKPSDLSRIWFALDQEEVPPSWVYIEMNDRKTNTKYKSNLAETTL
ncbi:MAG TPA: hypothetical protein VFY61_14390 [Pyrinomonadaceae bacterium]|nr:hypothetical protein [Pyrinomonadaceae bacterium]